MNKGKMKWTRRLTRNWGLKIISFLLAVTLWLVVANVDDPVVRWTYLDVPVTIQNADVITSQGMIYEVLDESDVVSKVTVYAPRSVGENIDKSDIVATADMNTLNSVNTLQIDFSVPRAGSKISDIRGSSDTVKVSIENKKNIQMVLKTNVEGDAPDGYIVGNVTTDQNLVRVSGPESVVNRVKSALINIDMSSLSEFTSDITTSVPIRLYDEEGNEVEGSTLTKNPESVMTKVEILAAKEVPLTVSPTGEPAAGYGMTDVVTCEPQTIRIAGKKSVLNSIEEIRIPSEAVDVTGAAEDLTVEVDARSYLPDNVIMADKSSTAPVSVTVGIEEEITEEYTLKAKDVRLENIPEGLTCSIEDLDEEYTVSITGIRSVVETISERNLEASLDVTKWASDQGIQELLPGKYLVTLQYNNPEHTELERAVTASMIVTDGTQEGGAE